MAWQIMASRRGPPVVWSWVTRSQALRRHSRVMVQHGLDRIPATTTTTTSSHQFAPYHATTLRSTLDDDPEAVNEEEFTYAPTTERDSYVSEADEATRANELAADDSSRIELQTEISNSFMQYAMSIIMGRAIPDADAGAGSRGSRSG